MLAYIFAGVALGSVYALAASGLVITYVSAGVLNFAFGSMAFVLARFYYYLNTEQQWTALPSVLVSVGIGGPALGAALYLVLFRHLRSASSLIRIVSTIGLSVALPPCALSLFGNQTIGSAPGLATAPVRVYTVLGTPVTLDQLIAFGSLLGVVVFGTLFLQLTGVGLRVRAMVDTEAVTTLSGVNPSTISVGAWMVSCALAGLAGVLAAPSIGLTTAGMTALMASAFAPVVAARLRNLAVAVGVAMAMGIVTEVSQKYLPPNSSLSSAIVSSIPFAVLALCLIAFVTVSGQVNEAVATGGELDAAIRPQTGSDTGTASSAVSVVASRTRWSFYMLGPVVVIVFVALLPLLLSGYWVTLTASGFAFAVIFLSFTLLVGEGGMIWLCQAALAGVGAIGTAQLATNHGWSLLLAVFVAALIAVPIGVVIGLLTIRLGTLYIALATLSLGLLAETLVFTRDIFFQQGLGVPINRTGWLSSTRSFAYFTLVVFVVVALIVVNLRRATTGLALAAVRYSEPAARTLGLSVLRTKLIAAALGAFIAALGGGLLAVGAESALPSSYPTFLGLVWLAVVVTVGVRSITAALLAGISFTLLPGVFQTYVPSGWGDLPTILFGLGAVLVAVNPDGQVAMTARQLQAVAVKITQRHHAQGSPPTDDNGGQRNGITEPAMTGAIRMQGGRTTTGGPTSDAGATAPRMCCGDVSVRFGGVVALNHVSITIPAATIVGLIGPNGAGKSTLFSVLSGLRRPNTGHVEFDGQDVTTVSAQQRARLGLGRTFQHPEMFSGLTVREHVMLSHRVRNQYGRIWTDMVTGRGFRSADRDEVDRVDTLLDMLGLTQIASEPVAGLPLGTTRLVELARSLATEPTVLLLDEPSTGLDARETDRVIEVFKRVVELRGVSLLLVEHDASMVLELCSAVNVLDFGEMIASGTPEEISKDLAVRGAYLGTARNTRRNLHHAADLRWGAQLVNGLQPLLSIRDLEVRYGPALALAGITVDVQAGDVLAVLGTNGAGKSTLARTVSGLVPAVRGTIGFDGKEITNRAAYLRRRDGIVYLPEGIGIFSGLTVSENLRIASSRLPRGQQRAAIDAVLSAFPNLAARGDVKAALLSGGEQQILSLARALTSPMRLLIADEMSLGLAPNLLDTVFEILADLKQAGVTIIVIDQLIYRTLDLADQCLVLSRGQQAWLGPADSAKHQALARHLGEATTT